MKARLKLFALTRQLVGRDELDLELPAAATVADLRQALVATAPDLAPLAAHLHFAINTEYAGDSAPIPPDADLACIPPVSGG